MADIEKWITINGTHIPIIKGESKARAVSNFIKGKQKARKSEIRNKLKSALRNPNSPKGQELLKNTANSITRDKNPTIRGRAKTRDEIEDERFDKYDEYAHNAARNIRFDNRAKPLSQDELYDRAHAVADASSMYDMDYKYGKGGTHENKQVSINDKIREARYKLKTNKPKKTITGTITDRVRRANKANEPYIEKYNKYNAQGDAYGQKAEKETRTTAGSDNRYYSARAKQSEAYRKAYQAEQRGYDAWRKEYDSKKRNTYKRKK